MHGVEWGKIRRLHQRITYHYSQVLCQARAALTIKPCLRRSQKPKFQYLDLAGGQTPEWYEAEALTSLGECSTPSISESPSGGAESFLSAILQADAPERYYLSKKACEGILRRAAKRGKQLPPMLKDALEAQINVQTPEN